MSKSRLAWAAVGLVLLVSVVLVALAGWRTWQINRELSGAVAAATRLETAIRNGDERGAESELASLRVHSAAARESSESFAWRLVQFLPAIGDDARGVSTVSAVVADLSVDGLEPLLVTSGRLNDVLPRDGRVEPEAVDRLKEPVRAASAAFDRAEQELAGQRPEEFVARFALRYRELASRITDAAGALRAADTAVTLMPSMLGAEAPRNYLLVFQNNAEVRATGGLPGAVSLLKTDAGSIELGRQVAASSFRSTPEPVLPLTDAELAIYDEQLGTFFLDANFTPDFPRTADLMRARWQQVYDDPLDGVISVDVVAMSYILRATGPVKVEGRTLTAQNLVQELLHLAYVRLPDRADQDVFFRKVARAVFDRASRGISDPERLLAAVVDAASESRIYVHAFDPEEQAQLAGTRVAGELTTDSGNQPYAGVYFNDGTGSKMSYFLRYDVQVASTSCFEGRQGMIGHAVLRSEAPRTPLPPSVTGGGVYGTKSGNQTLFIRLYGPVDGRLSDVRVGSQMLEPPVYRQDGRPVATVAVELGPQSTTDLRWRMSSGVGQTGDGVLTVTPGLSRGGGQSSISTACGAAQ